LKLEREREWRELKLVKLDSVFLHIGEKERRRVCKIGMNL